jgi:hypothetical protein
LRRRGIRFKDEFRAARLPAEAEVTEIKIVDKLDEKLFEKP